MANRLGDIGSHQHKDTAPKVPRGNLGTIWAVLTMTPEPHNGYPVRHLHHPRKVAYGAEVEEEEEEEEEAVVVWEGQGLCYGRSRAPVVTTMPLVIL